MPQHLRTICQPAAIGWVVLVASVTAPAQGPLSRPAPAPRGAPAPAAVLTVEDQSFLDDLEHRGVQFFLDQADGETGLVPDRAPADGSRNPRMASIAATGFGLTALCIADRRGWISHEESARRARLTLLFLRDKLSNEHGFDYHFIDRRTGERSGNCELSSIDTALLMAGVMTVKQYFAHADIGTLAADVFDRVDWPWMLNGGRTLSMGWTPENGFLKNRWAHFNEHLLLTLMAMGSRTHPLPAATWDTWRRDAVVSYAGRTFLQCQPLFVHQYPHAWIDFRGKADAYADYWQNSILATEAQRQFCIDLPGREPKDPRLSHYGPNLWGLTASDTAHGYRAWGGPSSRDVIDPAINGTVVPCAAGGSLPFAPRHCLETLRFMHDAYGNRCWKKYGFVDAFNPANDWTDADVLGIDVGVTVVMTENLRSGLSTLR